MGGIRPGKAKGPWVGSVTGAADVTGAANVGAGTGLSFRDKIAHVLNFRTILAGSGMTVTIIGDTIQLDMNQNIDGGDAAAVYLISQHINSGGA